MTNDVLPFKPPEPQVVRVLEEPCEILGVQGETFRGVELADGSRRVERLETDGTWKATAVISYFELASGICSTILCDNPGVCCPDR